MSKPSDRRRNINYGPIQLSPVESKRTRKDDGEVDHENRLWHALPATQEEFETVQDEFSRSMNEMSYEIVQVSIIFANNIIKYFSPLYFMHVHQIIVNRHIIR